MSSSHDGELVSMKSKVFQIFCFFPLFGMPTLTFCRMLEKKNVIVGVKMFITKDATEDGRKDVWGRREMNWMATMKNPKKRISKEGF